MEILQYATRDGEGNEIVKDVEIKEFPKVNVQFVCPICHQDREEGSELKKVVSGSFTDYQYMGDYICTECTKLFSLFKYSYVVDPDGMRLLNVRQIKRELLTPQKPPFRFVITLSQKKHNFYCNKINYDSNPFIVNLEQESILTTNERMKELFDFVECLQTLGASKSQLLGGEISFVVAGKIGTDNWLKISKKLSDELSGSREIQIPLYCGQKRDIEEEEAICIINSILTA